MSAKCGTKNSWRIAIVLLLLSLVACNSHEHLAPIEQLDQPPDIKLTYHTVSRNDTLYSIAWRYGVDTRTLASLNNLPPPYTIHVGEKINLVSDGASGSARSSTVASSPDVEVIAVPDDANTVTEVVKPNMEPVVKQNPVAATSSSGRWMWPTNGRIISGFSATDPLRKGIDLAGQLGEPVVAADSGSVVYAGSGLAGYGELVIIKHNEQFLSAYGHNSKLLIKEGDAVKAGQKIAEVGSSGTDSNKLHFEIRKDGKPVDPLSYLPKR
jgi:lipoprotein NlpD